MSDETVEEAKSQTPQTQAIEELTLEQVCQQLVEVKYLLKSQDESHKLSQMNIIQKNQEEIQRIEAAIKRMSEQTKTKVGDIKDEMEKKLFNSVSAILQQGADGQRSLETSLLRCEDNVETIQKMCMNIMTTNVALKELTDLTAQGGSLIEGICQKTSEALMKQVQDKLRTQFAGYYDFKQSNMDMENRFNHLRAGAQEQNRQLRELEARVNEKFALYLFQTTFEEALRDIASRSDMQDIKNFIKDLSMKNDCANDLQLTKQAIQKIENTIELKLATKLELDQMDSELRKFTFCKFVTLEDYSTVAERMESKLTQIDTSNCYVMVEFEKVRDIVKDLTEQMAHKVNDREIIQIHEQLGRFALYEDYKGLYALVVPPVASAQRSLETYSTQLAQFTEMIKRFDENINLRALKTELSYLVSIFKEYIKKSQFETFKEDLSEQLKQFSQIQESLRQYQEQTAINIMETMKQKNKDIEKRLDKRMDERFENIPGYEPPSLSQKLGFGRARPLEDLIGGHEPNDIKMVLKNKAEAQEVRKLFELKTNKVDSEIQMLYLDTLHRMLKNTVVLQAELIKQGLNDKLESEASKTLQQKQLYEQSVSLQRWVTQFDPAQTNFDFNGPSVSQLKDFQTVTQDQTSSLLLKKNFTQRKEKLETAFKVNREDTTNIQLNGKRQTLTAGQTHRLIKPLELTKVNAQSDNITIQYNSFTDRIHQCASNANSKLSSDLSEEDISPNSPIRRSQYAQDKQEIFELKVATRCKKHEKTTHSGNFVLISNNINLVDQLEESNKFESQIEVTKKLSGQPQTAVPGIRLKPLKQVGNK